MGAVWRNAFVAPGRGRAIGELVGVVGDRAEETGPPPELVHAAEERQRRDLAAVVRAGERPPEITVRLLSTEYSASESRRSRVRVRRRLGTRAPEHDVVRLVPDLPVTNAKRRAGLRRDANEVRALDGVVRRALELVTSRRRVPCARVVSPPRRPRRPRARAPRTSRSALVHVVDPGTAFDVTPTEAYSATSAPVEGHEVEVGLDVRR